MPQKLIDETGNKYGTLTVIEYTKDKNGRGAWLCQCECANTKIVRGSDLRAGKITHCSITCPCKTNSRLIDETGNKYGYLTVLYKAPFKSNSQKTLWHCKCECGNECDVLGESLRNKLTSSCGCRSKELNALHNSKDLTNQTFGLLTAIELVQFANNNSEGNLWRCKCNCGCERDDIILPVHRLTSGNTQSCGNNRKSHGEIFIENFLQKNNIQYKTEYTFKDLINEKNNKLRFDFAIIKNNKIFCLIEFDGKQHFEPVLHFGGQEEFEKRQKYDNLKNQYCQNNNILLLRIKYNEDIDNKIENFLKENKFNEF